MAKALVVYCTRSGNTRTMAENIVEGLKSGGFQGTMADVKKVKSEPDLEGYDGYVFGLATYHGDMMQGMKTMLFLAEKGNLQGRVGGAFGAYGWSGEAVDRIYDTMRNIFKMNMVANYLKQKTPGSFAEKKMAQDYGRAIARKITTGGPKKRAI